MDVTIVGSSARSATMGSEFPVFSGLLAFRIFFLCVAQVTGRWIYSSFLSLKEKRSVCFFAMFITFCTELFKKRRFMCKQLMNSSENEDSLPARRCASAISMYAVSDIQYIHTRAELCTVHQ